MSDTRKKNVTWVFPEGQMESWQQVQVAVLMDIRDELQILNRLLGCGNFIAIPRKLDEIVKNTKRQPRKPKA